MDPRLAVVLVLVGSLSGCGALATAPDASVSDPEATVVDDTPAITYEYSTEAPARMVLKGPTGRTLGEDRLGPDGSNGTIAVPDARPGTYTVSVRNGDDTIDAATVTFDGPDVAIVRAKADVDGNQVTGVTAVVRNRGDFPALITGVGMRALGHGTESNRSQWLAPDETTRLEVDAERGDHRANEAGETEIVIDVTTRETAVSTAVMHEFSEPELRITDVDLRWEDLTLEGGIVTVENRGDIPTETRVVLYHWTEPLDSTSEPTIGPNSTIEPGSTTEFTLGGSGSLYRATPGGSVALRVVAKAENDYLQTRLDRSFPEAESEFSGVEIHTTDLFVMDTPTVNYVVYTVENTGEVPFSYDTVTIGLNGRSQTVRLLPARLLHPGDRHTQDIDVYRDLTVPEGDYRLVLRLKRGDTVVASTNATVSSGG